MSNALGHHDSIMHATFEREGGKIFSAAGDGFGVAFASLDAACRAARMVQRELEATDWPAPTRIRVRMGVHVGVAEQRDGYFLGPAVNRAARIMSTAHGGQTVVSARVAEQLRADSVPLIDLGLHHLKDLDEPERIWQLGRGTFPALRGARGADLRLPEPATKLVGRSDEVAALLELLRDHRAITITGPGGIGKTRVALAVAAEAAVDHPDGVVFCDLGEVARSDEIGEVVAAAVGVRQEPGRRIEDTLVDWYRSASALLVLDNCEPVVEGARRLVDLLLEHCPDLRIIATSRQLLGSRHTVLFTLDPIPVESGRTLLIERIRSVDPSFDELAHSEAIDSLTDYLDGIPLAIELAAARCRGLSPAELVARLDRGSALLTDRNRSGRHQSVESTISGSYDSLTSSQQIAFARCSVFVGQFDLAGAEAVVGHAPLDWFGVAEDLLALVDASLIQRLPAGGGYRMLAPVRQAAAARLAADDGVVDHHTVYFTRLAEQIGEGLETADEATWVAVASMQFGDLRAAWERTIDSNDVDSASKIVWGLYRLVFDALHLEIHRWVEETTQLIDPGRADHHEAEARCLATAAVGHFHLGQLDELHTAVERLSELDSSAVEVLPTALSVKALAFANQEDVAAAAEAMQAAVAAARASGNRWVNAMALIFLRDFDAATRLCRELHNPSAWAWFHNFRGFSRTDEGRLVAAEDDFVQGEEHARIVGNTQALAVALNERAIVIAQRGESSIHEELGPIAQAIEIVERLRTPLQLWNSLEALAQMFAHRNMLEPAVTLWAAIEQEGVTPPSAAARPEAWSTHMETYRAAAEHGSAMDLWRAAGFARRAIRTAVGDEHVAPTRRGR